MIKNWSNTISHGRMSFMNEVPAELMREYGNRQNFSNTTVIMAAIKEMFRDALQQGMESELDSTWVMKKANERHKALSNRRKKRLKRCRLGFRCSAAQAAPLLRQRRFGRRVIGNA